MTNKLPISVFIIALNEGDRIGMTIESVKDWVDEVIVIDSGSSDDTMAKSTALGARAIAHAWPGYGLQKRFGEDQCRNRWILNLDADEVAGSTLKAEIMALFAKGEPTHPAWKIRIVEILPGRDAPIPLAHEVNAIRLYNKTCGRFSDSTVHDTVRMQSGTVGQLKAIIEHRSSRGLAHSMDKINRYSAMQAENLISGKGLAFPFIRLVTEFPVAFIKAYVIRGYIFGGMQGFTNAMVYAFSRFIRIDKYLEFKTRR